MMFWKLQINAWLSIYARMEFTQPCYMISLSFFFFYFFFTFFFLFKKNKFRLGVQMSCLLVMFFVGKTWCPTNTQTWSCFLFWHYFLIKYKEGWHLGLGCMRADTCYGMNDKIDCNVMRLKIMQCLLMRPQYNDRTYQTICYLHTGLGIRTNVVWDKEQRKTKIWPVMKFRRTQLSHLTAEKCLLIWWLRQTLSNFDF